MFSRQLENDFQHLLENEACRHFQMFGIFIPYGETAPLNTKRESANPSHMIIGIGGHLTVPPLPHHRAYGSPYHGGSIGLGLQGRAFGCWLRHQWFGPLVIADRGFTPSNGSKASEYWVFLPLTTHELPVLLATPNRSGLRPSFPARPIRCSAFRPWSASLALPTAWPTMPSADSCVAVRRARRHLAVPSVPSSEHDTGLPR
jgi:hypothetical protein